MRWTAEYIVGQAVHLNAGACLTCLSVPTHRFPIRDQPSHPCPGREKQKPILGWELVWEEEVRTCPGVCRTLCELRL